MVRPAFATHERNEGGPGPGGREAAVANISLDPGNAVHEYTHHLQLAMPELDGLFQALHRQRTAGDPVTALRGYRGMRGREDWYIDAYFGREYGGENGAIEVITRGYQILFSPLYGRERLGDMARDDPEMLDLLLGALFHYNPS